MFLKVIVTIFCLFAFNLKSSISQNENNKIDLISIVAIVNDEPITIMDLNSRTQLIIASSNLPNNIETKRNLQGQIIQSLIQEKLQAQEAEKLGIRVSNKEVENTIKIIENNNNIPHGVLIETLYEKGVPRSALPLRLEANLIVDKLLQQVINPKVIISQNEINNEYISYLSNEGKYEYKLSEITFNYNTLSKNNDILLIAKQIRKKIIDENNFEEIAKRIQENGTGKFKKDNFWRLSNTMNAKTYDNIKDLKENDISNLILLNTGISIVRLDKKRKFKVPNLSQTVEDISFISFDLPINKSKTNSLIEEIRNKTITIKSCNEMSEMTKFEGNNRGKNIGKIVLKSLPEHFVKGIENIKVNQPSYPILAEDGIYVMMVCERNNKLNQEFALKEKIKENIRARTAISLKERYLLDLNRKALIDIRM